MGFFDFLKGSRNEKSYSRGYNIEDVVGYLLQDLYCGGISYAEACCVLYWVQADFLVNYNKRCFESDMRAEDGYIDIPDLLPYTYVNNGHRRLCTGTGNYNRVSPNDRSEIAEQVREIKKYCKDAGAMFRIIKTQLPYKNAAIHGIISTADLHQFFTEMKNEVKREEQKGDLKNALYKLNINISPIKDGEFKSKLCRMYDAINNVLIATEENPVKEKDVRRLTEYYIPTMVKLLGKYSRLSGSGRKTPEVEKTIKDIEALPDEIIEVANAVYDDLMEENLIDINADISVLKQKAESDKAHKEFIIAKNGDLEKTQAILYIIWDTDGIKDINPNASEEQYAYICSTHRYYKKDSTTGYWNHCEDSEMSDVLGHRTVVVR